MATASKTPLRVRLPHKYHPRSYQVDLFKYLESGGTRGVMVHHRRAGKTKTLLNLAITQAFRRVGTYLHVFPELNQGRRIIWDGIDRDGMRYIDHFPPKLIKHKSEQEMQIELVNGSIWQIMGSDKVDRLVGANGVGYIFDEYSLQDPRGWDLVRPILRENGGWALFVFTPRGENHGYEIYQLAQENDDWFCSFKTVDDTTRDAPGEDGTPVLTSDDIDADRREGMTEEMVQQEYFCSFSAGVVGSYYGAWLGTAKKDGRVGFVPHDPGLLVDTSWDIGIGDSTAIWFKQQKGQQINYIDYYEASGVGIDHYVGVLRDKGYTYGRHVAPHDIENREWGSTGGKSRLETARELGIRFQVAHKWPVDDGIAAVRRLFSRMWFDAEKCKRGIAAIGNYQKLWDDKKRVFLNTPLHNWASHGADGLRYDAIMHREPDVNSGRPSKVEISFNPIDYDQQPVMVEVETEWNVFER